MTMQSFQVELSDLPDPKPNFLCLHRPDDIDGGVVSTALDGLMQLNQPEYQADHNRNGCHRFYDYDEIVIGRFVSAHCARSFDTERY